MEVKYTVKLDDVDYDIVADVDVLHIENNGIGDYEYWGSKGYDYGEDYVADFAILNVNGQKKDIEETVAKKIVSILENDRNFGNVVNEQWVAENKGYMHKKKRMQN